MSVVTEQFSVKYQGTGEANEQFPIPFSFRHTDVLKVTFVNSSGARTLKTISTHYTVVQYASSMTSQSSSGNNIISSNSQRTEYGWVVLADGVTTSDVVHIYREETFKQEVNDFDQGASTTYLDTDIYELSLIRLTDALSTTLTRDTNDPSAFTAKDRQITSLGTPVRHNDILTYSVLSNMNVTASLSIPASGGASDNGKLLAPTGLSPSTPTVGWTSKLTMGVSLSSGAVLSPVADYANSPYVEWVVPRWVTEPPNNSLSYVYSYDVGGVEGQDWSDGESTSATADWREFREMHVFSTIDDTDMDKVVRMDSATSSSLISPNELPETTNNAARERHIASDNGTIGLSPRFHFQDGNQTANLGDSSFSAGSSGEINSGNIPHPTWSNTEQFAVTNDTKNDSNATADANMVFIQPWTVAVTSTYSSATAYPVFVPYFVMDEDGSSTYGVDLATDSNVYKGEYRMMNYQQHIHGQSGTHTTRYLHWSGDATWKIHMLTVFQSGL